jgi:hypothetical protein
VADTFRVLVTGSRAWPDGAAVHQKLRRVALRQGFGRLVVVHGACPTGADAFADEWARENADAGVTVEPHPADWDTHGKAAGPLRNTHMVQLTADLVLAFPLGASRGTRDCMSKAQQAGLSVWVAPSPAVDE